MSIVKFSFSTIMEFQDAFSDNRKALQHVANIKWVNGFMCSRCGNKTHCRVYDTLSRECQSCNHIDSPTAGTLFHKVKFPLWKAFWIIYQMSMAKKGKPAIRHLQCRMLIVGFVIRPFPACSKLVFSLGRTVCAFEVFSIRKSTKRK
jgi:hypothetical protein